MIGHREGIANLATASSENLAGRGGMGSGFRVQGSGFRVQGSGFRVHLRAPRRLVVSLLLLGPVVGLLDARLLVREVLEEIPRDPLHGNLGGGHPRSYAEQLQKAIQDVEYRIRTPRPGISTFGVYSP